MEEIRFLEDIAIADAAYEVKSDTLEGLFKGAATGLFEVMVNTKKVEKKIGRKISLCSTQIDLLLFDWLSELIYLKDKDGIVFSDYQIEITQQDGNWALSAIAHGDQIDYNIHEPRSDVKAVTYHNFSIAIEDDNWVARLVLDI